MAHLAIVGASVAAGTVVALETERAEVADGVLAVLTDRDLPKIAAPAAHY